MEKIKKYLPSKKFFAVLLVFVIIFSLFITIKQTILLFKDKIATNKNKKGPTELVVGSLIQKDSNSNGIADWEEYLWGLNPAKNGQKNKEFIESKKKALTESGDIKAIDESQAISDSEMLSREFFATIVSLQQTGTLDDESLKSISEALGKNVEVAPIPDVYTSNMLIIKEDSVKADTEYGDALAELIGNYSEADIGSELTFVIQGLSNNDPQALYAATTVAKAYQSFGNDLMKIPVPNHIASIQLSMANNYEKVGQSIFGLTKMLIDPMTAMRSIINYKNYSDALAMNFEMLSEILQ